MCLSVDVDSIWNEFGFLCSCIEGSSHVGPWLARPAAAEVQDHLQRTPNTFMSCDLLQRVSYIPKLYPSESKTTIATSLSTHWPSQKIVANDPSSLPPMASTKRRHIKSPRPVPRIGVVSERFKRTNFSKILSLSSRSIPWPSSHTLTKKEKRNKL